MSYYQITDDNKFWITSFNDIKIFSNYFKNLINNIDCMGVYCMSDFFFERYTTDTVLQFKNSVIRDYINNNTEEFINIVNNHNYNNIYVYFSDYAIVIDKQLNVYKIYLKTSNKSVIKESRYHLSSEPVNNNYNFKNNYSFDEMNELKNNIIECLKDKCSNICINDYYLFGSSIECAVNTVNKKILTTYIINNIETVLNNTLIKNILIHMYDENSVHNCHSILITINTDNINVDITRTNYY